MLVEFTVSNFLSLKDSNTLSMEAGTRLRKFKDTNTFEMRNQKLLKNVITFGANGSGKTNLCTALGCLRNLVINPTPNTEEFLSHLPFKLSKDSTKQDTVFNIKFIKNNSFYEYELKYNRQQIIYEALKKDNQYYFKRANDDELIPEELISIRETLRKNKLLLFDGQDKNNQICIEVFQWFKNDLIIYNEKEEDYRNQVIKSVLNDAQKKVLFINLLNLMDINIEDIGMIEDRQKVPPKLIEMLNYISESSESLDEYMTARQIYLVYNQYDVDGNIIGQEKISYNMESSGTKKIMMMIALFFYYVNEQKVIVIDEFDNTFHTLLAQTLVKLINSEYNQHQFILTSHNLELLDTQLRIDQIYLTEKNFLGETELYSLFDIDDIARNDIKFVKRYLDGRFGGLPDIDFEGITELFKEI